MKNIELKLYQTTDTTNTYAIRYQSTGHWVNGFVVIPKNTSSPLPCIIYNRGGSFEFGKITDHTLHDEFVRMASWGYVVIGSQYSGNAGSEGQDEFGGHDVEDILCLRDYLAKIPEADSSRIGMFGYSRGGMMTYLCLSRVYWIRGAVVVGGITDLVRGVELRPEMRNIFSRAFGGTPKEMEKRSALKWADTFSKTSPLLIMHGANDWRVSPLDALDLSRELLRYKVPHRLILFEGAEHNLTPHREEMWMQTKRWFDTYIKCMGDPSLRKSICKPSSG